MKKFFRESRTPIVWLMIVALVYPEPLLMPRAFGNDKGGPSKTLKEQLQERVAEKLAEKAPEIQAALEFQTEKAMESIKNSLPSLLESADPEVRAKGHELMALWYDLLPVDLGVMEQTAAINGVKFVSVTPADWKTLGAEIVAANSSLYDEIVVYSFENEVASLDPSNIEWEGKPWVNDSLSYSQPKVDEVMDKLQNALVLQALANPQMLITGGIFGFRRGGGNGGVQRNYQQQCGDCYSNPCGPCGSNQGGRSKVWVNPNYRGGGQTTLGATCCSRAEYGVGLGGPRNSRFTDVKGIGLRQSFQRYEGPPFGQGRAINFLVNPTCVQRARRRLAIVITTVALTAGGGGAAIPFLIPCNMKAAPPEGIFMPDAVPAIRQKALIIKGLV
ncbi:MAG TPA: hypothetical protein PKA63_05435 [Oligoflexia bacterium]|nr:hypothetical protein [Oligoflexia bacterium]HMP48091.1 hypothetical protein [Oligoflexia bacterium]